MLPFILSLKFKINKHKFSNFKFNNLNMIQLVMNFCLQSIISYKSINKDTATNITFPLMISKFNIIASFI